MNNSCPSTTVASRRSGVGGSVSVDMGAIVGGAGAAGLCGYYMQPIMDKTHYKMQMVYPVPNTQKDAGQCCQPFGRTTMIWGAGKEFPVTGEDFSYQIFRKRNCCAGAY